jgi:hypothetical protein
MAGKQVCKAITNNMDDKQGELQEKRFELETKKKAPALRPVHSHHHLLSRDQFLISS